MPPPPDDAGFARWLATRAGEALLALRPQIADPAALRDAGDKRAHDLLVTELARWRPGDAVLSEEAVRDDVAGRLAAERVWIVDPLDGTREFGEPGRSDWAVHVALWSRAARSTSGASGAVTPDPAAVTPGLAVEAVTPDPAVVTPGLVAGAVALPAQDLVLATDQPPPYPPAVDRPVRIVVSRSRPPAFVVAVAEAIGAELVPMGSAGAKVAAVITGEVDAYLHAGGQYEWDSAAPVAVASATGLHTSRVDGSRLVYNQADPRLPDLLVCRRELADRLLAAIEEAEETR
jgi:3'(2'), 5'-bisphosphate nucleotidase